MHAPSSPPPLCVTCIMGAQGSRKRALDCMGLEFAVELSQIFTINTYDFYNQKENGKQVPPLVRG